MPLLDDMDWSGWLLGLWAAIVGGGATAASGAIAVISVDPRDFNLETQKFWKVTAMMFTVGAATNFLSFLKQNPAPKIISKASSTTTLTGTGAGQVLHVESTKEISTPVKS